MVGEIKSKEEQRPRCAEGVGPPSSPNQAKDFVSHQAFAHLKQKGIPDGVRRNCYQLLSAVPAYQGLIFFLVALTWTVDIIPRNAACQRRQCKRYQTVVLQPCSLGLHPNTVRFLEKDIGSRREWLSFAGGLYGPNDVQRDIACNLS
jgi:hypothetical protein